MVLHHIYTPENEQLEPKNHQIENEHHLNQTFIFGFKMLGFSGV